MNISTIMPCVLLLLVGVGATTSAGAAPGIDSAELSVNGAVRLPACALLASGSGHYDYGARPQSVLPATGHVPLPSQDQTWTVDCGGARTYLMYSVSDNRAASASEVGVTHFGLGSMPGVDTSRIGYYTITMANAKVDGLPRSVLYVDANGTTADAAAGVLYYKTRRGYSWHTSVGTGGPWADFRSQAGSRFEVDMRVSPFLASRSVVGGGHPIVDTVNLDGSATVTFSFGL